MTSFPFFILGYILKGMHVRILTIEGNSCIIINLLFQIYVNVNFFYFPIACITIF